MGDHPGAGRRGGRSGGAEVPNERVRGLVGRHSGLGRNDDVGDHGLIRPGGVEAPLQSHELGLSGDHRSAGGRTGQRLNLLCALHVLVEGRRADQLVVRVADAILHAVLESEDRQKSGRDAADHDRQDHHDDHQLNEGEPAFVQRRSFQPDPATHATARHDQRVDDLPAPVHCE